MRYLLTLLALCLAAPVAAQTYTLQPDDEVTLLCPAGTLETSTTGEDLRVRCVPPVVVPPPTGLRILGASVPLLDQNGGGVLIHTSSGPMQQVRLEDGTRIVVDRRTWEGHFQADDRPGGEFVDYGCTLDTFDVVVGGDNDGGPQQGGYLRILVYAGSLTPVTGRWDTPTPGWVAASDWLRVDPGMAVAQRSFAFSGANRIALDGRYSFTVDTAPDVNTQATVATVKFNAYTGARFINDGFTQRTLGPDGVLASPAFWVWKEC